jgi:Holliday junction DNA helicase RuvB
MTVSLLDRAAPLLDNNIYPTRWADYIGQEPAKKMLQVSARSAKIRKVPMKHTLITHPSPGIGKTALAVLLGIELKRPVRLINGNCGPDKARLILSGLKDGDVLFCDEAHTMTADWWLTFLQDGYIAGPLGPEDQPRVTVIAATTDPGKMPEAMVSRFAQPPMQDYTAEEATKIAQVMARSILHVDGMDLPKLGKREAAAIAEAGHCNPRAIRRLLNALLDLTITDELPLLGERYDVPGLLAFQGITPDGLDPTAQRYLRALAVEFGGMAGARAIEDRLQQAGGLGTVERMLMDKGFIAKTRSGRRITQAGIKRFRELEAS